jgi:glycine/D-amino acid oxidase-like deaminating enzyme
VAALVRLARRHGARVLDQTRVERVEEHGHGILVTTERGVHAFDRAVLTAGPWMGKLLARARLPLVVTRQWAFHLRIERNADLFQPARLPVWIDADTRHYGVPADGEVEGVKVARHARGPAVDPDHTTAEEDEERQRDEVLALTRERLPDLSSDVVRATPCLYTNTTREGDDAFVIDRVPGMRHAWLVSGCSGHGFKFAVLFGRIAADLVRDRRPCVDLRPFALARFGG